MQQLCGSSDGKPSADAALFSRGLTELELSIETLEMKQEIKNHVIFLCRYAMNLKHRLQYIRISHDVLARLKAALEDVHSGARLNRV